MKDWRTDCRRSQKAVSDQGDPLLPRKPLKDMSAPRQCKKKAIKPHSPPWPTGSLVSGSPCILQYAVFLFSSLQIKSFHPLLLESACAFIPRAGSNTLSTWNSCVCHRCINLTLKHCQTKPSQFSVCVTGASKTWLFGTNIPGVLKQKNLVIKPLPDAEKVWFVERGAAL
jgi:hypothetical protein